MTEKTDSRPSRLHNGLTSRVRAFKVTLWTLIVPPATWAAHFLFSYLWASISCAKVGVFARFPLLFAAGTLLALLVIVAAGVIALIQGRAQPNTGPHERGTDTDRTLFLAKSTELLAGLSFVGVVFTALPVIMLTDCR